MPHLCGNLGRRTEQVCAARDIGKGLVDGDPLDQRGEIVEDVDGGVAEPLVVLEMAADENQLRTNLARSPPTPKTRAS